MREIIPKVLFCACNILCLHRDPPSICNNRQDLKKMSCFRSHKCHYIFITKQLSLQNNVFLLYYNIHYVHQIQLYCFMCIESFQQTFSSSAMFDLCEENQEREEKKTRNLCCL